MVCALICVRKTMHNIFKYSAFGASLLVSSFLVAPSYAEEIIEVDPIAVEALMMMSYPASASYDSSDAASPLRYSDGADYLGSLPGLQRHVLADMGLSLLFEGSHKGS